MPTNSHQPIEAEPDLEVIPAESQDLKQLIVQEEAQNKDRQALSQDEVRALFGTFKQPKKRLFLRAYSQNLNQAGACREAGINPSVLWYWKKNDAKFAQAMQIAQEIAADMLEEEAYRRAFHGNLEGIYQKGQLVGLQRKYSDLLTIFFLKGAKPNKYRDNVSVEHDFSDDLLARFNRGRERVGQEPIAIGAGSTPAAKKAKKK